MYKKIFFVQTFNRGEKMKQRKFKRGTVFAIYGLTIVAVMALVYGIDFSFNKKDSTDESSGHVSKTIFDTHIPVVSTDVTIIRPYTDNEIKIVKNYYDYQSDEDTQKNSIIYHDNVYMQNSGVCYGGKDNFDVVSILSGEVIDVKEDELLGNVVTISHDNNLISVYQSLGTVDVKKGDMVNQGQKIGTSGTSNISVELNSHLSFELIHKGINVNPENYYNKKLTEI